MKMTTPRAFGLFFVLLLLLCIEFYNYQFFQYPYNGHDWANSDKLALALRFYDDGMNFFLPATYNMGPINGVAGVEFPLQAYLAALGGKIIGRDYIAQCFRGVDIAFFIAGQCCLFLLLFRRSQKFWLSLMPLVFLSASPVFIEYSGAFVSDPATASLVFCSFLPLSAYLHNWKTRNAVAAMALLSLATLMKTSEIIYMAGAGLFIFADFIKRRRALRVGDFVRFLGVTGLGLALIIAYFFYNRYLNEKYHSGMFLAKTVPFEGFKDFSQYWSKSFSHQQLDQYFIVAAYLLWAVVVGAAAPILRTHLFRAPMRVALLFFIFLMPVFWLMGHQLHVHDYYVPSLFFPIIVWMFIYGLLALNSLADTHNIWPNLRAGFIGAAIVLFCLSDFYIYIRLSADNPREAPNSRVPWLKNGKKIMTELHIPQDEQIVVLNEDAPNRGLIYFDRKGYNIEDNNPEKTRQFLEEKGLRIAVVNANSLNDVRRDRPEAYDAFDIIYEDEKTAVLRLKK